MAIYNWKRYWRLRGEEFHLEDSGYLPDPETEWGAHINPRLVQLKKLTDFPCLVMLGAPGVGKSTEFVSEFERIRQEVTKTSDAALRIDLQDYQTDIRLIADAFNCETTRQWRAGGHVLHLFFDSLDEGRLEIANIANILSKELKNLEAFAKRLRLRITCRTAVWPQSLEQALKSIWGEEAVRVVELLPLRHTDIIHAAEFENIDPSSFLAEVRQLSIQPFAADPISLRFLLEIKKTRGALPQSKQQIYEDGCRHLCNELSESRRDAIQIGDLSSDERMQIASRIAAFTVFCGRLSVDTGASSLADEQTLRIADLAGDAENVRGILVDVREAALLETVGTALFTGHGRNRLRFAHRTHAEFLAARYVTGISLDPTQLGSLIFHADMPSRVIPQLWEVAAWIANCNHQLFQRMLQDDPQSLLRSDVAGSDNESKSTLVANLLIGFQAGHLDDSDLDLRGSYWKLAHRSLAEQLRPIIRDTTQQLVTRRFAIDIAENCRDARLLDALLFVAMDQTDNPHIRAQAVHAVIAMDKEDAIVTLTPLALSHGGSDPDDELKGAVMRALWSRKLLSASDLFENLTRPRNQALVGAYYSFLSRDLVAALIPSNVPFALRWLSGQCTSPIERDGFEQLSKGIVNLALARLGSLEILDAFATYLVSRIKRQEPSLVPDDTFTELEPSVRRHLVARTLSQLDGPDQDGSGVFCAQNSLLCEDDLDWLLEPPRAPEDIPQCRHRSEWARFYYLYCDNKCMNHLLELLDSNPIASEVFADLFGVVQIDSALADQARESYARLLEFDRECKKRTQQNEVEPPPEIQIRDSLDRFERGDLEAWWQLNRDLQLGPNFGAYLLGNIDDLTSLPGWIAANEATRQRIVAAARRYLAEWQCRPELWLGTGTFREQDLAGYRALVLLERVAPTLLASLADSRWANIAPAILGFPTSSGIGDNAEATQKRLVKAAYDRAPYVITEAMITLVDHENSDPGRQHLFTLRRVEQCREGVLLPRLLAKARDPRLKPLYVAEILRELIVRGLDDAIAYGIGVVSDRVDERSQTIAIHVATVLWLDTEDNSWDTLWPIFRNDLNFFRDVMTNLADGERASRRPLNLMPEDHLADLSILLSEVFPQAEDPQINGVHFFGPREHVVEYRDHVLASLKDRGTWAACGAMKRIQAMLPQVAHLSWITRAACRAALAATWTPLTIEQFRELSRQPQSRLVRNGQELRNVIQESLARLQEKLQGETPAARDLWDRHRKTTSSAESWEPVDENDLSDYIKRHLAGDLERCGIVALREVEIRSGHGELGERTDIYVAALLDDPVSGAHRCEHVVIEVKGCWHVDLKSAIQTQLRDRYLKENACDQGLYIVGWFVCDSWNKDDRRFKSTPKWSLQVARKHFEDQALRHSREGASLAAIVLDVSLR